MKFYAVALLLIAGSQAVHLEHHHHHHHEQETLQSLAQDPCPAMEISAAEMGYQMEMFSRTFDKTHYDNAMKIAKELKPTPP